MITDGLNATEAECAAGRTAPRVSLDDIKANISGEYFNTADLMFPGAPVLPGMDLLTICILVLRNGFTIIGKSAPASRDNFDPVLGQKLAYEDAVRQIWPLMGYALRQQLHDATMPEVANLDATEQPAITEQGNAKAVGVAAGRDASNDWHRVKALELALGGREGQSAESIVSVARKFIDFIED